MPHINRYRYINFIYGKKKNRLMTDMPFEPMGENMQVEATNTVGKSISILTLLQPIVPFIDTNKKSTDVFTVKKEPFYVLVEWILENGTKLLTGIGIQRKQTHQSDDNKRQEKARLFEYIIFTVEYDRENPLDINNIPLTEIKNNRFYCKSIKEAEEIIKGNKTVKTKVFTKSKIREYKEYLRSFAIYTDEWKSVIAPLNKGESQLTEYFEKNNTIEKLMKNVILPAVEENINQSYSKVKIESYENKGKVDQIKDIQGMLLSYKETIDKHKNNLKDYERLKLLEEKMLEIKNGVENAIVLEKEVDNTKKELSMLYNTVKKVLMDMEEERLKNSRSLKILDEEINDLSYNEKSNEYHKLLDKIKDKEDEYKKLLLDIEENEKNIESIERDLNLYKLKEQLKELSYWEEEKSKRIAEKEKLELTEKDILSKLKNLGYSINTQYKNQINEVKKQIEELKNISKELEKKKKELKENETQLDNKRTKIIGEEAQVKSWIQSYKKKEEDIINKYNEVFNYIEDTFEGKRYKLDLLIQKINNEIIQYEKVIETKIQELGSNKKQFQENARVINRDRMDVEKYNSELKDIDKEIKNFIKEKDYILTLFTKYNIDESLLYLREEVDVKLKKLINSKSEKLEKNKERKKLLEEEIDFLKGGNNIIPEKIKEELQDIGIKPITGLEFLNKQDYSNEKKKEIYDNNPFLPYSLMITKREYELLKSSEFKGENTLPIPLTLFNDVETVENEKIRLINNVCDYSELKFITFFDRDILDEERVKSRIKVIKEALERLNEVKQSIEKVINELRELNVRMNDFQYHNRYEENLKSKYENIEKEKELKEENITSLEKFNTDINQNINKLEEELPKNRDEKRSLVDKQEAISSFNIEFCKEYNKNYNIKLKLCSDKKEVEEEIIINKSDLTKNEQCRKVNHGSIIKIEGELENTEKESSNYINYSDGDIIEKSLECLKGEFKSLNQESKASDIVELDKAIGKAIIRVDEIIKVKDKIIKKVGDGYEIDLHKDFDEDELNIMLEKERDNRVTISERKSEVGTNIIRFRGDLEKIDEESKEKFGKEPIKYKSQILVVDYEAKRKELEKGKNAIYNLEKKLTERKEEIAALIGKLEEFKGVTDKRDLDVDEENLKYKVKIKLNALNEEKEKLEKAINDIKQEELLIFQYFMEEDRKVYEILAREIELLKKLEICTNIKRQIDCKLDILEATVKNIDNEREYIFNFIKDYVDTVIRGISKLNDIAKINGQRLMRVAIRKENIDYSVINRIIDGIVDETLQVNNYINTFNLLDQIVKIKTIKVEIIQYELYSSNFVDWDKLETDTTGAQQFCISFILLTVLMEYKRIDEKQIKRESFGKVLVMDNPFGEISEASLLKPMFELAKKLKVQIISYTHIQNQAIRDSFGKIYLLKVNKSSQTNREYVEGSVLKDSIEETAERSPFFAEEIRFIE